MKKTIVCLALLLFALSLSAQDLQPVEVPNFKLYPTANMWTFLKLDTRNGVIRQVQFSVEGSDKRFETYLNLVPLVTKSQECPGRFELYPTENNYNFIMLDRVSGQAYQVQWSQKPENRGVVPIE